MDSPLTWAKELFNWAIPASPFHQRMTDTMTTMPFQAWAVAQIISTGTVEDPRLGSGAAITGGAVGTSGQAAAAEKERCVRLCNLIYRLHCKLTVDQRMPGQRTLYITSPPKSVFGLYCALRGPHSF